VVFDDAVRPRRFQVDALSLEIGYHPVPVPLAPDWLADLDSSSDSR
jgi:hypothetical protein